MMPGRRAQMDFLVELLVEIIGEFLLDGTLEASMSEKVPKKVRILLMLIVTVLYGAFIALFLWLAVTCDHPAVKCLMAAIGILCLLLFAKVWKKFIQAYRK